MWGALRSLVALVRPCGHVAPSRRTPASVLGLAAVAACVVWLTAGVRPARAQTVYVAFGDSITAGVGDDPQRAETGYPPRLEALLQDAGQDAVVVNEGVGGEKTPEGLSRIDQVLDQGGDVLLLMEGSNDISRRISIETTLFDLGEMARRAEERGWTVVHGTVIPRIPNAGVDGENITNRDLNGQIRNLAGTEGRDLVDNFYAFSQLSGPFDNYYLKDPEDHVGHPNADGYDVMAATFADVLTGVDSVPPVPGIVSPRYGSPNVRASTPIEVEVWDFGAGIDLTETDLLVNGESVGLTGSGSQRRLQFRYQPPAPLSGVVRVTLRSSDLANPANSTETVVSEFSIAGTDVLQGDLDFSGRVDGVDLVLFARHFGATKAELRYSAAADFNSSGTVDGQDLAILAANFGLSSF